MTTCVDVPSQNILDQAILLYKKEPFPQTKLLTDIINYATFHHAYFSPTCCILAKVVEDRGWFIYLAVGKGCLQRFFEVAPFEMPWIGFARPEKSREEVKWYPWKKIYDRVHKKS